MISAPDAYPSSNVCDKDPSFITTVNVYCSAITSQSEILLIYSYSFISFAFLEMTTHPVITSSVIGLIIPDDKYSSDISVDIYTLMVFSLSILYSFAALLIIVTILSYSFSFFKLEFRFGNTKIAITPSIAIIANNSTKVKAFLFFIYPPIIHINSI